MIDPESTNSVFPASLAAVTPDGRLLLDSEGLAQAVYLYSPVFDGPGDEIVDLMIVEMNEAAKRLRLATHIRPGVLASEVFVDMDKALDAANAAWRGTDAVAYDIERHSMVGAQPIVVHYEVSTIRAGDRLVQVAVDHTTVAELESAEMRFKLMADGATDGLVLLSVDEATRTHLVAYANLAARQLEPAIRVGEPAPRRIVPVSEESWGGRGDGAPSVALVDVELASRRASLELRFVDVGNDMVMLTIREITTEAHARAALERSDRVLQAVGAGSFGVIAVYECVVEDGRLSDLSLAWTSEGEALDSGHRLSPADVVSASELVDLARLMWRTGETRRHGWVSVNDDVVERAVEFTLVQAGDRFVLEFVERTDELRAQTTLAMVQAGLEAQQSFVSRISHELRSPLNVIHGYSQLMAQMGLPDLAARHLSVIERGIERMVQVVDDLLLLGQIDQGLLHIDLQAVPCDSLVASLLTGASRCQWWVEGALVHGPAVDHVTLVRTDPVRFTSAALLVAEASAAVQHGIEVALFARGARAGIQFVAPADSPVVDAVWRPFLHSHAIPGAGMGLAVARGMAGLLKVSMELREHPDGRAALVLLTHIAG